MKLLTGMLSIHLVLVLITSHWYRFYPFYLSISLVLLHKCQGVFSRASCTSARHAGSFDCLMTNLILITMDNVRGHCAWWQSCKVPNQTHKWLKMYAIKQIKICAEYWDMLPRPRLDLSGTPGLRPIGLSPGSWQTSLGLGSMSRYSAQILICIIMHTLCHFHKVILIIFVILCWRQPALILWVPMTIAFIVGRHGRIIVIDWVRGQLQ